MLDPFDGYPYLVTRIGHTQLRHITIAPAGRSLSRLVDFAQLQRDMNRLDTCLVLGPAEALYFDATGMEGDDGDYVRSTDLPLGLPVIERLAPAEALDDTPRLIARRARLARYAAAHRGTGYLVGDGLEGGRSATPSDIDRLAVRGPSALGRALRALRRAPSAGGLGSDGVPSGLARCPACDQLAGEFLAVRGEGSGDTTPRVIDVHCQCANHNRCAACGEPLAESRLSAYHWSEPDNSVRYLAAYAALAHKCEPLAVRAPSGLGGTYAGT